MIVQLKCFTTLAGSSNCDFTHSTAYELTEGQTVEDLINFSGINMGEF